LLISLRIWHMTFLIINYERHPIMNLKLLSIPAKEMYHNRNPQGPTRHCKASGPASTYPSPSMESKKKTDYHRWSIRSYPQDGRTRRFRTLPEDIGLLFRLGAHEELCGFPLSLTLLPPVSFGGSIVFDSSFLDLDRQSTTKRNDDYETPRTLT